MPFVVVIHARPLFVNGRLRVGRFGQCRSERAGFDVAGVITTVRRYHKSKKKGADLVRTSSSFVTVARAVRLSRTALATNHKVGKDLADLCQPCDCKTVALAIK